MSRLPVSPFWSYQIIPLPGHDIRFVGPSKGTSGAHFRDRVVGKILNGEAAKDRVWVMGAKGLDAVNAMFAVSS